MTSPQPSADYLTETSALTPTCINFAPGAEYATQTRIWQGIPGIEITPQGRLFAAWYSGGTNEGPENYVILASSEDDGATWSDPLFVIDPPADVRAFDPVLWHDPQGRLWFFWSPSKGKCDGRFGLWFITTEDSDAPTPQWTEPQRIDDGIMMNKPTVLSTGEWLLPVALWDYEDITHPEIDQADRLAFVVVTADCGCTWQRRGGMAMQPRTFDEHMIVERRDGTLWMLVRLLDGIGESFSTDAGHTWTPGVHWGVPHVNSRFFIRRLQSGNLLLVKHHHFNEDGTFCMDRSHLMAFISKDDGQSWEGGLLLDERIDVSYPDGVQASDGRIYVVYDRDRFVSPEILMAVFWEEDVLKKEGRRSREQINGARRGAGQ